ncbi:MAG: DUF5683 domain-containing protein [Agriterribacter sp.]
MIRLYFVLTCCFIFSAATLFAQQDTTHPVNKADTIHHTDSTKVTPPSAKDSVIVTKVKDTLSKKSSPARKAAILSAIIPGAGQAYNRKYWKMPIVYGALAIPIYTFTDNLKWFKRTRYAFNVLARNDTANYKNVYPQLKPFVDAGDASGLKNYRAEFRKNVDYSVLAFIVLWGLNVVDAAVDGHMKDFNVNDDLSIQIKPGFSPDANTAGLSVIMKIGKRPGAKHFYATR